MHELVNGEFLLLNVKKSDVLLQVLQENIMRTEFEPVRACIYLPSQKRKIDTFTILLRRGWRRAAKFRRKPQPRLAQIRLQLLEALSSGRLTEGVHLQT
jgi:hypothetical protein